MNNIEQQVDEARIREIQTHDFYLNSGLTQRAEAEAAWKKAEAEYQALRRKLISRLYID